MIAHRPGTYARLTVAAGGLELTSSYSADFVADFKRSVPAECRRFVPARKVWIIEPRYGAVCRELVEQHFGLVIDVPTAAQLDTPQVLLIQLDYLGRSKDRGNGEPTAYGYANGEFSLIFPEKVLREWFELIPERPGERPTLYGVLMGKPTSTVDELRASWRRLVFQWHPDRCGEVDATEQFKAIQHAWEVLSDPRMRKKYDAGMALQASADQSKQVDSKVGRYGPLRGATYLYGGDNDYRSPLRCGMVLLECTQRVGRLVVSKVFDWQDVQDAQGRTMVSSWPAGAEQPIINWV